MTSVVFTADADGRITGFEASGHSGYAESGKDIVCAAISALTQAALIGLEQVVRAPVIAREDEKRGMLSVRIESGATQEALRDSQILLETLKAALTAVSGAYPGTIRIIIRERRESHVQDESSAVRA